MQTIIILMTIILALIYHIPSISAATTIQEHEQPITTSHLLSTVDEIGVNGPTTFPKPTHILSSNHDYHNNENQNSNDIIPIVKPIMGKHRYMINSVIFAYAEGYALSYYMMFIEAVKDTGYIGDVVSAIADDTNY